VAWVVLRYSNAGVVAMYALPGNPHVIARLLFHDFLLPFEVTSLLILIAIMGAVVLASPPGAIARRRDEPAHREMRELAAAGKER
jgi:NADH:ubiquinone oxidoreductase subunit 6 (subunit J)